MKRERVALALMRVVLGTLFVWSSLPKFNPTYRSEQLPGMLRFFAEQGAVTFYKGFLFWAADHARIFGYLTAVGEIVVGAALILGLATGWAVLGVVVMCVNYFLATRNLGPASIGVNFLCVTVGITLILGGAGQYIGLDGLIQRFRKKDTGEEVTQC